MSTSIKHGMAAANTYVERRAYRMLGPLWRVHHAVGMQGTVCRLSTLRVTKEFAARVHTRR